MARSSSDGFSQHRYSDSSARERGGGSSSSSSSRAGRLLGYSSASYASVHNNNTDAVSELNEEDVWDLGTDGVSATTEDVAGINRADGYVSHPGRRWMEMGNKEPGLSGYGHLATGHKIVGGYTGGPSARPAAVRMIPPLIRESNPRPVMHQSAPVNVPDWSKILGSERGKTKASKYADDNDSDKDDAEEERLPPHLQIQREYAQSTTFSVCEGAGRTLKGRDLSRVRNAVLRQTGFFDG